MSQMYFGFSDMGLSNVYTQRERERERLTEADPILEICDYSTDVMKSNVILLETVI